MTTADDTTTAPAEDTPPAEPTQEEILAAKGLTGYAEFPVTKAVNLGQFRDELRAAASNDALDVVLAQDDPEAPVSESNPGVLWVSPDTTAKKKVTDTITAHTPDANYGLSAAQVADQEAIEKIKNASSASDVTTEDLFAALKAMTSPAQAEVSA